MKRPKLIVWGIFIAVILLTGRVARADPAAPGFVTAAGRGNPWLNLLDGQSVPADYSSGPAELGQQVADSQATPLSLAADDFDGDGVPGAGVLGQPLFKAPGLRPGRDPA